MTVVKFAGVVKHNVTEYVPDGGVLVAQGLVGIGVAVIVAVGVAVAFTGLGVLVGCLAAVIHCALLVSIDIDPETINKITSDNILNTRRSFIL